MFSIIYILCTLLLYTSSSVEMCSPLTHRSPSFIPNSHVSLFLYNSDVIRLSNNLQIQVNNTSAVYPVITAFNLSAHRGELANNIQALTGLDYLIRGGGGDLKHQAGVLGFTISGG